MPRPNKSKRVCQMPMCQKFYAGRSKEDSSMQIMMSVEEFETLRLMDYLGLTQEEAAIRMEVGRGTVQALYMDARRKIARYLVEATSLEISGGNYEIEAMKGVINMKIAVTYENGQIFQHFGHCSQFKIYTVEDGKIIESVVVDTNGSGHGALAGFLKAHEVQTLICGGIGGGAKNALTEMRIELFAGASGDADAQVDSFLAGNLAFNPNMECAHHGHHDGEHHGHGCGGHQGGHREGHGCGHHKAHEGGCGHHCGS